MRGFPRLRSAKGNRVNIPEPERGYRAWLSGLARVRQRNGTRRRRR